MTKECEWCSEQWEHIVLMCGDYRANLKVREWIIYVCNDCFINIRPEHMITELQPNDVLIAQIMEIHINFPQTEEEKLLEEIWYKQMYGAIRSVLEA